MRLRYKPWADELVLTHQDLAFREDCLEKLPSFNELEIGCGQGEFTIKKAASNPQSSFLGVEICYTAFAICLKKMLDYQTTNNVELKNLHFINTDADKLFEHIKPGSLDAIYLNFNDPWPKKRHHKRRLTWPLRLQKYYDLLKPNGKVYYKTDNDLYYEDSKKYFVSFDKFKYEFTDDYQELEAGDVMSEYEQKFRKKGQPIHRIVGTKPE